MKTGVTFRASSLAATLALSALAMPAAAKPSSPNPQSVIPLDRFTPEGAYILSPERPTAAPSKGARFHNLKSINKDRYDNLRAAAPQNYAITAPPSNIATVRPMVEWEQMTSLLLQIDSSVMSDQSYVKPFVEMAKVGSAHGEIWVVTNTQNAANTFKTRLATAGMDSQDIESKVKFSIMPVDSIWLVDSGPLPIIDTATDTYAFADFRYYHERTKDDAVPSILARRLKSDLGQVSDTVTYRMPLTTEGGTFQSTTSGICITSSRQLANMSSYYGGNEREYEAILALSLPELQTHPLANEMRAVLKQYTGCQDLIITHSVTDDGTGHIDIYLKILDDNRILVGEYRSTSNADDVRSAGYMNDNAAFLEAYVGPKGERFSVVRMPMPGSKTVSDPWWGSYDVPFTYINSTFFNGVNLWPAYTFPEWVASREESQEIWDQVLPNMEHVWIDSEELAYGSGAIHCVTRTIPAKAPSEWVAAGSCGEEGACQAPEGGYEGSCSVGTATDLCNGPQWLCSCNHCENCPEVLGGCGDIKTTGCCDSGDVYRCNSRGQLEHIACGGVGCGFGEYQDQHACGYNAETSALPIENCGFCEPACDGKSCGDDGCGGSCGSCGEEGQCVSGQCRTDCDSCTPGTSGCDEGGQAWTCEAGPDNCNTLRISHCENGCSEGACQGGGDSDTDGGDTGGGDTGGGDTGGGDTGGSDVGGGDTGGGTHEDMDDGCAGGESGVAMGLFGLAALWVRRRRA